MNLLAKLEAVEVNRLSRLAPADLAVCQRQEALYLEAIQILKETVARMEEAYSRYSGSEGWNKDGYLDLHDDIRRNSDRMGEIRKRHIGKVCGHFERTYHVTIDEPTIIDKYKELPFERPTYQEIVEEIHLQLGGFTFEEKAVREIKEAFTKAISRRGKPEIKGTRLILYGLVSVDHWDKRYGTTRLCWDSMGTLRKLFSALSHYESNMLELTGYYHSLYHLLDRNREQAFQKHELGYNQVQAIRLFQNGKTEITFETYEQAESFMKNYILNQ